MLHRYNFVCFVYFISYNSLVNIYNVILFVKYVNKKSIYKLSIYTFRIFFYNLYEANKSTNVSAS